MDDNLSVIIDRVPCHKHGAEKGLACWHIPSSRGTGFAGICNKRAVSAGFRGTIHPSSMRKKSLKKS